MRENVNQLHYTIQLLEEGLRDLRDMRNCVLCGKELQFGDELGFCEECQKKSDFPYDLDKYYSDYDKGKVAFKGFETLEK